MKYFLTLLFFTIVFVFPHPHTAFACTDENGNGYPCDGDWGRYDPCRDDHVRCGGEPSNPTPTPIPYLSSFDVSCQFAQNTGGVERLATDAQPFIISSLTVGAPSYSSGGSSCPSVPTPECTLTDDEGVSLHTDSYGATKCICHFPVPANTCVGSNTPIQVSSTSLTPCTQSPDPAQTANLFYPVVGYPITVTHDCTTVGPWIKLIDASFVHTGKSLMNDQPFIIDSFDQTDTDLSGMSGGAAGVVANVAVGETGRVSKSWWTVDDYEQTAITGSLDQLASTLLRTKPYQIVTPDKGKLVLSTDTMNVLESSTAGAISSFSITGTGKSIVLLVKNGAHLGPLVLSGTTYNTSIGNKSLLVLSSQVTFSHRGDVQIQGVVIADQIDTGAGSTLKVVGNLICTGDPKGCVQGRSRTDLDHARPSVLIQFDPDQYLHLLPYLGKQKGEWEEK
ncbi:MAG: hypothetical protein WCJ70_03750 [bacterium]